MSRLSRSVVLVAALALVAGCDGLNALTAPPGTDPGVDEFAAGKAPKRGPQILDIQGVANPPKATSSPKPNLPIITKRYELQGASPPPIGPAINLGGTAPGWTVTLTGQATDPAGGKLTYTWSATGGSFNTTTGDTVLWTPPAGANGPFTITLTVTSSASGCGTSGDLKLEVSTDHINVQKWDRNIKTTCTAPAPASAPPSGAPATGASGAPSGGPSDGPTAGPTGGPAGTGSSGAPATGASTGPGPSPACPPFPITGNGIGPTPAPGAPVVSTLRGANGQPITVTDPHGLAVAKDGTLLVTDWGTKNLSMVKDGKLSPAPCVDMGRYPFDVLVDDAGTVWGLAGQNENYGHMDWDGTVKPYLPKPDFGYQFPFNFVDRLAFYGVARTHTGMMFASGGDEVYAFDPLRGGGGPSFDRDQAGYQDGPLNHGAKFAKPYHLAADSHNNVYVADYNNHCIRKIAPDLTVTTFAGKPNQPDTHVDGPATTARFGHPMGMAIGAADDLYVSEEEGWIRRVAPDGTVTTVAGSGQAGSADGAAQAARFNRPVALACDGHGHLYVSDAGNNAIRVIDLGALGLR